MGAVTPDRPAILHVAVAAGTVPVPRRRNSSRHPKDPRQRHPGRRRRRQPPRLPARRVPRSFPRQAGRQVSAAFEELSEAFAASRRRSFDEMAEEMIRPMLREWMDNNLPVLVERLVREEIERVARGA